MVLEIESGQQEERHKAIFRRWSKNVVSTVTVIRKCSVLEGSLKDKEKKLEVSKGGQGLMCRSSSPNCLVARQARGVSN